jgi:predicted nucleotidyltransferase
MFAIAAVLRDTKSHDDGSIARGQGDARSDIDLMFVGSIATARLLPVLRGLEQRFKL